MMKTCNLGHWRKEKWAINLVLVLGFLKRVSLRASRDYIFGLKELGSIMAALTVATIIGPTVLLVTWGMLAYDIYLRKRGGSSVTEQEKVPSDAPRVLVEFSEANPGHNLVFISDKRAIVRNVGDLRSAERYESNHEFSLSPATIPVLDKDRPVKCKMLGMRQRRADSGLYAPDIRSLVEVLRDGTPQSEDSVVIDYDDEDGNQFSRRFFLTRNQDDSVAWIPDPVVLRGNVRAQEVHSLDLVELRQKVRLATAFPEEHRIAQECIRGLDRELGRLDKLRNAYSNVLLLREHYNRHSWQLRDMGLTGFDSESGLLNRRLPTELGAAEVTDLLENHKKALLQKAEELSGPYVEALNA
jgi:hypothetical protein